MSCIIFVCLVLFPAVSLAVPMQGKIVNGTNAAPGEFPYAVSYRYFEKHNCGASIIGHKWILTAAHCIHTEFNHESNILFGTTQVEDGIRPTANIRDVKRAIRHPDYEEFGGYENDIGVVELTEPIEFNDLVQPIALPPRFAPTPAGAPAVLVGWGYAETNGHVMDDLQTVNILVYSDEECTQSHGGLANSRVHICAGVPEGGKGQCSGDSGGPLAVDGVQIGTVSWSAKPCTHKGSPGVFAKVATYRDWIFEITGI